MTLVASEAKHWCNVLRLADSSNQSCSGVHYCLKLVYLAGSNAVQYGITVIQPSGDERINQDSTGLEWQAAYDTVQLSELVETPTDDMADTSSHCQFVVDHDSEVTDLVDWGNTHTTNVEWLPTDLSQLLSCAEPDKFSFISIPLQSIR